jgi:hypothetical protein
MSRTDAFIYVNCDGTGCDMCEEVQLTALAGGAWDERDVSRELERMGWVVAGSKEYCDGCAWQTKPNRSDDE